MKRHRVLALALGLGMSVLIICLLVASGTVLAQDAATQGSQDSLDTLTTAFSYQGRLQNGDGPVSGACDFRFELYALNAGGSPLAAADVDDVAVSSGYFDAEIDFGAGAFVGERRWLGVKVKCGSESGYTDLGRHELTGAPQATYAMGAPGLA